MIILLLFAFLSGLVTIFAPCIWPLLPIILSSSSVGGRRKPLGITLGICISFALFTLTISYIEKIFPFDPNVLRFFAVVVIGFLGLSLVIPKLSALLESFVSRMNGRFLSRLPQGSGFWGGLITGVALGLVWSPCAGPILATIATLAATTTVNLGIVIVTLVYVSGVGIPLFIFASVGQKLLSGTKRLSPYTGKIQQVFGVIMILTALAIFTNYDKLLQAKLSDLFPSYSSLINGLESNSAVTTQLNLLKGQQGTGFQQNTSNDEPLTNNQLPVLGRAPDFVGITKWLNTEKGFTINDLRGKVVLVDFWTYTCINCIRTLPYTTAWYDKYHDQGFVLVGVHTPEFEFEKNTTNVQNAIKQYNIHYPVAQDNNYATWNNYSNQYWPAEYLIDAQGNVREAHFGEGDYDKTEQNIQALLKEAGSQVDSSVVNVPEQASIGLQTPESYLGYKRIQWLAPSEKIVPDQIGSYTIPNSLEKNYFGYGGNWMVGSEYANPQNGAVLEFNYQAREVYLVMRPKSGSAQVKVFLDGQIVNTDNTGDDVKNGLVTVDQDRLYRLIKRPASETHTLKLQFLDSNLEVYAFTFG